MIRELHASHDFVGELGIRAPVVPRETKENYYRSVHGQETGCRNFERRIGKRGQSLLCLRTGFVFGRLTFRSVCCFNCTKKIRNPSFRSLQCNGTRIVTRFLHRLRASRVVSLIPNYRTKQINSLEIH